MGGNLEGMKDLKEGKVYTMEEVLQTFPRCTESMVRNYRWKHSIGHFVDGELRFTEEEVMRFVEDTEFENIKKRNSVYEYIKSHPGITEEQLVEFLPYPKYMSRNILAEISSLEYYKTYSGLYEDEDGRLYVEGFERVPSDKRFSDTEGIFFSVKRRSSRGRR